MSAMKTGLLKVHQPARETQKEIFKAMEKKRAKTEPVEIVIKGPRMEIVFVRIFAHLQARFKQREKEQEEDPVLLRKRETTRKETEKEIPNGKDPKVRVRQESQRRRYATLVRRDNAKRNLHAIVGSHQNAYTIIPRLVRVYSSTRANLVKTKGGNATRAIKLDATKELNRTICSQEDRMATVTLRKDTSVHENE